MPRNSKPTKPVAETVVPVVEKVVKEKKPRAPKTVAPVVPVAPVCESAPITLSTAEPETESDAQIVEQSNEFIAKLQQLGAMISTLKTEYRVLEKKWSRELKQSQKLNSKKKRKAGNRAPSGFVKPTKISEELSKFLEKPSGCEMARTEVTREINNYIRKHNLQDKENGRKIIPDVKLASLLKLSKTDELTYFNLQKFMSPHFAKNVKEAVV
jgi:upstream activation factor subunit UAF30